ncbi:MAG: ABC transporter substrate-binding protein [Phycisphaerales bacterium]
MLGSKLVQALKLGLLAATATLALGLAGCEKKTDAPANTGGTPAKKETTGGTAPAGDAAPAPADAAKPGDEIVIGHYGSLTGNQATFGKSTDNGIKLAVDEANAAGGVEVNGKKHKIKLVSDDTEGKADKAGTVVTKLITKDKVVAVLGEVASKVSLQGAPVCQEFGVPMITPSSTNSEVTKVGDMIFRVCYIDPFQGKAAATFVQKDLKLTKVALLFDQSGSYSVGLKDEFSKAFRASGGTIVSEQAYNEGDPDFSAQLTRIREANPEAIFVPGYYSEVAKIAIQGRKLGLTVPLIGGDGWDSEELGKNAKDAIEGCFYSNHYAPDQATPEITEFVSKYQKAYGGIPDGLAALGYDAAKILFASMSRAKSLKGTDLRDAIAATKDFKGVTGSITLNADRDAVKPVVMVERKGGEWRFRATIAPE